jgi:hypothetical protein
LLYSLLSGGGSEPPPPPTGCGQSTDGSLPGTGASQYHTYTTSASGTHQATLRGPNGTDFDLYLQKRNSSGLWSNVASSLSSSSVETISYSGTAGSYRWRVYAWSGSGSYTLTWTCP